MLVDVLVPTPLGRTVTVHFLAPTDALALLEGIRRGESPPDLVALHEVP